jgi:hypothetical protein
MRQPKVHLPVRLPILTVTFALLSTGLWLTVLGARATETNTARELGSSLAIKIESSRPRSTAGAGLGIIAELRNTSKSTDVFVAEDYTVLALPPELGSQSRAERGFLRSRPAFFPTDGACQQE